MPYAFYKVAHLLGVMLLFLSLGGVAAGALVGRELEGAAKKLVTASHGIAMLLLLVAGFGLLARLNMDINQPWVWGKLAVWLVLGGSLTLARKKPDLGKVLWFALPLCGALAAWLAVTKPGMQVPEGPIAPAPTVEAR